MKLSISVIRLRKEATGDSLSIGDGLHATALLYFSRYSREAQYVRR